MKAIGDVQRHEGGGPLAFRKVIQWKGSPVGRFAALGSYAHRCGAHNQWLVTGEEITRMITLLKLLLRRRKLLHCDARRARVHKQALPQVLVRGGRAQFSARVSHFFTGAHNSESSSVMTGLDLDSDRLIETLRAAAATILRERRARVPFLPRWPRATQRCHRAGRHVLDSHWDVRDDQ